MNFSITFNKFIPLQILTLAIFMVYIFYMWQGNKGFSLWDEGFLWYGAQRVMLGEIPIRDFLSYDPGRYYWSATLMNLWSDNGIMSLRRAVAVFQTIGLFVGLLLIARTIKKQNFFYLLLSAITLIVWMFPRHKLFDISLSILLIGVLAFLIQNPTNRRYFFTGLCIGLIAVFGRNHGVYGVVASLGVMFWLNIKRESNVALLNGAGLWAIGIVIGFSPILFMVLLIPGFGIAFWESIRFLFEIKTTNLPLPVPWPWEVDFVTVPLETAVRGVCIGLFFIATVAFGILSITWVVWQNSQKKQVPPVLAAASFLALPYAHFAYSRADVSHLSQGIFPLLIGCLVFLSIQPARLKWPLAIILCGVSLWVMHIYHPGWYCYTSKQCVDIKISDNELVIRKHTANDIELLRKLVDQYAPDGQSFMVTPFWPGAYPLFGRKSPMWEIYAILPRNKEFEQAEIERIKTAEPGFVLVFDLSLDGRDELRFQNTHPLIYRYIYEHFDLLPNLPNSKYQIFKVKGGG